MNKVVQNNYNGTHSVRIFTVIGRPICFGIFQCTTVDFNINDRGTDQANKGYLLECKRSLPWHPNASDILRTALTVATRSRYMGFLAVYNE